MIPSHFNGMLLSNFVTGFGLQTIEGINVLEYLNGEGDFVLRAFRDDEKTNAEYGHNVLLLVSLVSLDVQSEKMVVRVEDNPSSDILTDDKLTLHFTSHFVSFFGPTDTMRVTEIGGLRYDNNAKVKIDEWFVANDPGKFDSLDTRACS